MKQRFRIYRLELLVLTLLFGFALPACGPARDESQNQNLPQDSTHASEADCLSSDEERTPIPGCIPQQASSEQSVHNEAAVTLSPEALADNGIRTAIAGPATLAIRTILYGRVAYNGDQLAHIQPRYSGVATSVHRNLGDQVTKGDLLTTIESTESLSRYEVRSLASGSIVARHVSVGDYVEQGKAIFLIADLGTVWIDFDVFPKDYTRIAESQRVSISAGENGPRATTTLSYLAPISDAHSQARLARAVVPNAAQTWLPGRLVTGSVETGRREVAVAVPPTAIQRRDGAHVVFLREGESFRSVEVKLGARNELLVEAVSGRSPGSEVVSENSFLLKAELGKSEAHHDH